MSDLELLRQFVQESSQSAFAELVRRHVDWVYSTAARRVRDPHLAEDVTQATFIVLAQKAHTLADQQVLSAWLFHVVWHTSAQVLRQEARRRRHETRAAALASTMMNPMEQREWDQIVDLLDHQVRRLSSDDREAILLRFYEKKNFAEVGSALGISEEAARKRISRATDKLRNMLESKGASMPLTALSGLLLAEVSRPAPAGIAQTAAIVPGAGSVSLAKGAIAIMAWTKVKTSAAVALAALLLVGGGVGITLHFMHAKTPATQLDSVEPLAIASTPQPDQSGEYYIGGQAKRTGVYSLSSHEITLLSALIAAGGFDEANPDDARITMIRKRPAEEQCIIFDGVPVSVLMHGMSNPEAQIEGDIRLAPEDEIMVQSAQRLASQKFVWGPVKQAVLSIRGGANRCLDLETGKVLSATEPVNPDEQNDEFMAWCHAYSADVLAYDQPKYSRVMPLRMLNTMYQGNWEEVSPEMVREKFLHFGIPPQSSHRLADAQYPNPIIIFRTRRGMVGKMQELEMTADSQNVRLQYCLAEPVQAPTTQR